MNRQDRQQTVRPAPTHESGPDDRWLAELPSDLAALSLSSDSIVARDLGDMGCVDCSDHRHDTKHRHEPISG